MKVVVTGASGFLGDAVVKALRNFDTEVIPVSRSDNMSCYRVSAYHEAPRADILIHLAEDSDRQRVNKSGKLYERAILNTLDALIRKRYNRIVYASSGILYGDRNPKPHKTGDVVHITDTYTSVKRRSEIAILENGDHVVARLANIYGPRMAEGNVLSTILNQIPNSAPLTVRDGTPIRDFLWIEDAAAGLARMALGKAHGVFNLGCGEGISIAELARLTLQICGQDHREFKANSVSGRSSCIVLDINETKNVWGWRPTTHLRQGLQRLIALTQGQL